MIKPAWRFLLILIMHCFSSYSSVCAADFPAQEQKVSCNPSCSIEDYPENLNQDMDCPAYNGANESLIYCFFYFLLLSTLLVW